MVINSSTLPVEVESSAVDVSSVPKAAGVCVPDGFAGAHAAMININTASSGIIFFVILYLQLFIDFAKA